MADEEIPSEGNILRATLIPPSGLPAIISLRDFTALFPASVRGHSQIPDLYRALQHDRALDLDFVQTNIDAEVKRGERQQRELLRTKLRGAGGTEGLDIAESSHGESLPEEQDLAMDEQLYSRHGPSAYEPHTLSSILPAMDAAITAMEKEVSDLEAASEKLQSQLESNIGDLSDLRYGKLSGPGLRKDIIENLRDFAADCDAKGATDIEMRVER